MRYAVLVKPPDDHPGAARLMGTFDKRDKAEALAVSIRAAVENAEGDGFDDSTGYAYVIPIEKPRVRSAIRWALRGE